MTVNFSDLLLYKQLRRRGLDPEQAKQMKIDSTKAHLVEKANQIRQNLLVEKEKLQPPPNIVKVDFLTPERKLNSALMGMLTDVQKEQLKLQDAREEKEKQLALLSVRKNEALQKIEQLKQILKHAPLNPNIKNIYLAAAGSNKKKKNRI